MEFRELAHEPVHGVDLLEAHQQRAEASRVEAIRNHAQYEPLPWRVHGLEGYHQAPIQQAKHQCDVRVRQASHADATQAKLQRETLGQPADWAATADDPTGAPGTVLVLRGIRHVANSFAASSASSHSRHLHRRLLVEELRGRARTLWERGQLNLPDRSRRLFIDQGAAFEADFPVQHVLAALHKHLPIQISLRRDEAHLGVFQPVEDQRDDLPDALAPAKLTAFYNLLRMADRVH
mmetsp:Transcript_88092/g.247680  ORF Transcript_88092/g.247680 Transcript_88092/m.247680 type:complete len:236 (+) Transcript_88092:634-1341(+)